MNKLIFKPGDFPHYDIELFKSPAEYGQSIAEEANLKASSQIGDFNSVDSKQRKQYEEQFLTTLDKYAEKIGLELTRNPFQN